MDATILPDSAPQLLPKKHRRPALSCGQCRKRRVKCDRNIPCTRCIQSKHMVCVYEPDQGIIRPRTTNHMTKTASTKRHHGEGRASNVWDPITSNTLHTPEPSVATDLSPAEDLERLSLPASAHLPSERHALKQGTTTTATLRLEPNVEELQNRIRELESMVYSLMQTNPRTTQNTLNASIDTIAKPPTVRGGWDKTEFYGIGHCLSTLTEVRRSATIDPFILRSSLIK